jgi:hypothetical protein
MLALLISLHRGRHARLVITLSLLPGLLLEAQSLVEGVVQLGVCVRNLLFADECPIENR